MSKRSTIPRFCALAAVAMAFIGGAIAVENGLSARTETQSPYARWTKGPSASPDFFPIAVWLQSPSNAARYQAAGINLYVGLWQTPTQAGVDALEKAGVRVICEQDRIPRTMWTNRLIAGWMHNDEPDNAQWGGRFGPPVSTEKVRNHYGEMHAADPSRPVLLNLGQAVAWDNYNGRGLRRNHPEDYPEYLKGCDIASFDIYPVAYDDPATAGKLELIANGVERLVKWNAGKPVWNCIECTRISNTKTKVTPAQMRTEVWMSLIHGSRGLIYFAHQFKPVLREAALLDDAEMLAAVTAVNRQIRELAPVLNSRTITNGSMIVSSVKEAPIAGMVKQHDGATYLFTACMRNIATQGRFKIGKLPPDVSAEVLGENRNIPVVNGEFRDEFKPYEAHLYRLKPQ